MRPTPTGRDRLPIFTTAERAHARRAHARRVHARRARGLLLNVPEAAAPIADTGCEAARGGARSAAAIEAGRSVLGVTDVLPGVVDAPADVEVEAVSGPPPLRPGSPRPARGSRHSRGPVADPFVDPRRDPISRRISR